MALFLAPLIASIVLIAYLCYECFKFTKVSDSKQKEMKVDKKTNYIILACVIAVGVTTILSSLGLICMKGWVLTPLQVIAVIFGSLVLGSSACVTIVAFILRWYRVDLEEKQKKTCKTLIIAGLIATILGLWLFTEGIASQDIYPLINGFNLKSGEWTTPGDKGGIKFYGIIIVCGALICYFITDHEAYKKYGDHGLIDTLFIVAFLAGVIGARLWYCLILEKEYFLANPTYIFYGVDSNGVAHGIMDGGLAIQGGALGGIIVGVAFVLIFRKYMDVRFLMDVAIPTILLAQALGRWGNFLNGEVFGQATTRETLWYVPSIVANNMELYSKVDHQVLFRVPLFIIESVINICGYFIIRNVFGKLLKFGFGKGYQSACYITWYGLVRVCLEPLRDGFTLEVGSSESFGYMQSWITGFVMVGLGILLFVVLYFIHKFRMQKGLEDANGDRIKKAA